ncbi:MAG: hypothetical protein A2Z11_00210 [Candidatus Woykebacteria bacterium RBG_16_43_9]|uniref:Uncharacterized protein n=1 Tax=Candidatus Woykebacteria bacterium RBG_16_43_9 TaxID=1802596 RepID=A0A1G1WFS7_9BACT|nr:MAG: hypothetical protein A2Z11_00210 [Candidatus Woykebacteria bacterium RBG_16_43_9]
MSPTNQMTEADNFNNLSNKDPENSPSTFTPVIRYLVSGLLIIGSVINFVFLLFYTFPFNLIPSYNYQTKLASMNDLREFYKQVASFEINTFGVFLWVILPSSFLLLALILIKPKKYLKIIVIWLIITVIAYAGSLLLFSINHDRFKDEILNHHLNEAKQIFKLSEYPHVVSYKLTDECVIGGSCGKTFEFNTKDNLDKVKLFYLDKGFEIQNKNTYIKRNGLLHSYDNGEKVYFDVFIRVTEEDHVINVWVSD